MDLFHTLSAFIFVIPVCLGLMKWNSLSLPLRMAWLNPFFALVVNTVSTITTQLGIHNHFLYYPIAIIAPFLYLLFYLAVIRSRPVRTVMITLAILNVILVLADYFWVGVVEYYNTSFILMDILLILVALWVMYQLDLPKPVAICNWAIFIYLISDLTYSILSQWLYNYLQNEFLYMMQDGIQPLFNILRALMFAYAFWIAKDLQPPDFSEIEQTKYHSA